MAAFALSDNSSIRSASPSRLPRQVNLEAYFSAAPSESSNRGNDQFMSDGTIEEVSEPTSPNKSPPSDKFPGTSAITTMLRNSPPHTSAFTETELYEGERNNSQDSDGDSDQGRLIISRDGVRLDATERTPLLNKNIAYETHHPDWIREQQDIERQQFKRRVSWPKLRNLLGWPRERGVDILQSVLHPKSWNRKAIWQNAVKDPISYLPSVFLGTLLNILDALSYGMYFIRIFLLNILQTLAMLHVYSS